MTDGGGRVFLPRPEGRGLPRFLVKALRGVPIRNTAATDVTFVDDGLESRLHVLPR